MSPGTQAYGKTEIEPDGACDDDGRKLAPLAADETEDHPRVIPAEPSPPS